jgi:ribonucleoside-diphosphate reductase alpha chain
MRTGEPYIHFITTSNRTMPEWSKALGLKVTQSNICTEITTALDPIKNDRTGVCCLSSINLDYYDEFKDNYQFYRDIAEMLDNVLDRFIKDAPESVGRAKYSAMRERAIGVGALGLHSLLQSKGIPFESALATSINNQVFSRFKKYFDRANRELGQERGECPDGVGYGVRFSLTTSIAPNASSSVIMGNTSPSVELFRANAYRQDTLSGSFLNKNRHLDKLIRQKCTQNDNMNYDEIWSSIVTHAGSIQHLDIFTNYEKLIFKTATEVDQRWVVSHAADRQQYIDQSQSINLFFKANATIGYLHHVHFEAWKKGLKTLYYCRSDKLKTADNVSEKVSRERLEEQFEKTTETDCLACE